MLGAQPGRKQMYASAASAQHGVLGRLTLPWLEAQTMSSFLAEVASRDQGEALCATQTPALSKPCRRP